MNPPLKVSHYRLEWNINTRTGNVVLLIPNAAAMAEHPITDLGANEFAALSEFLRSEKPIFYDPDSGIVKSGSEMVGEEEM